MEWQAGNAWWANWQRGGIVVYCQPGVMACCALMAPVAAAGAAAGAKRAHGGTRAQARNSHSPEQERGQYVVWLRVSKHSTPGVLGAA